jgi:hypothetical protein
LFKAVSQTLMEFGRSKLGGLIGFTCVLHTWDQTLRDHFHLHCLIAAGALSMDGSGWIPARKTYLFSVKALGLVFRGKMLDLIKQAFIKGELQFPGRTAAVAEATAFSGLLETVRNKKWVVYAKRPFSSPEKVLDYLGRYTQRVAISNNRILSVEDSAEGGRVTFSYRDRRNGNRTRTMTLEAWEFIRRFLLHVLPDGLMRIRHYGLLANRSKNEKLARCRELLGNGQQPGRDGKKSARQIMLEVTGLDLALCPACGVGRLVIVGELPAIGLATNFSGRPAMDSS